MGSFPLLFEFQRSRSEYLRPLAHLTGFAVELNPNGFKELHP
jgi:hypothetical protein